MCLAISVPGFSASRNIHSFCDSKPHFGLKKHSCIPAVEMEKKNMEKRHQDPNVLGFELFIGRQTHVLAQINKKAQNSSKNGV